MKKIKLKVELGLIDKLRIRINGYIKICDDLFLVKCSKCNNHFFDHLRGYNN